MPSSARHVLALGGLLALATGCAEHLQLRHDLPTPFWTGRLFWPPPPASAVWVAGPAQGSDNAPPPGSTLLEVADRVSRELARRGYVETRVIPVGLRYAHGFAVATRLERIVPGGAPEPDAARWSQAYPEAPELRWLAFAATPAIPSPGPYRTTLIAFSDLPLEQRNRPPVESEATVMDGPDVPRDELLPPRRVGTGYRFSLHVYEFVADAGGASQMREPGSTTEPAGTTAARMGLAPMGWSHPSSEVK